MVKAKPQLGMDTQYNMAEKSAKRCRYEQPAQRI